jgi:cytochrome bd-type quinol oxidase subunit 2
MNANEAGARKARSITPDRVAASGDPRALATIKRLTLEQAAAGDATLVAVLISVAVGLVLVVPSLYLLYSLVLKGRLDEDFEPLDQRFRPLTTSDHPKEKR